MARRFVAATAMAALCLPAQALNNLGPSSTLVTPTFHTAGIRLATTGDDNANCSASLQYRAAGTTTWKPAQPLARISTNRLAGLLFNLNEGTSYEARITPSDPEGSISPLTVRFTTRVNPRSIARRTLYVSTKGSLSPTGSSTAPFGTIQAALKIAQPGDTILVQPGTYRESVLNYTVSGTPDAPITIKAAAPGVIMTGAQPTLSAPHSTLLWKRQPDGSHTVPLTAQTSYVAVRGRRLFHHKTREALTAAITAKRTGWWQDSVTKTLYAFLGVGVSPDSVPVQVSQLRQAFCMLGVHDIIIDGLDLGFFGTDYSIGIYINKSSRITVRNCSIHNVTYGIYQKDVADDNLIENCTFDDPGMEAFTWTAVKGTDQEGIGVLISGGKGNVVRQNRITGFFNGVVVLHASRDTEGDTDVYQNYVHDVGDDGMEPEGHCINERFWSNTIRGTQNGISLAPIQTGPVWVLYNQVSQSRESGLKVANSTTGPVRVFHNTIVTTLPATNALSPWGAMTNFVMRNNIFYGSRYIMEIPYSGNQTADYDILFTTNPSYFVKWNGARYYSLSALRSGTGQEAHGQAANPMFRDAVGGVFLLEPGSPARDRAQILANINDYLSTPDIGAYQM